MKASRLSGYWLLLALTLVPWREVIAQFTSQCPAAAVTSPSDLSVKLDFDHGKSVFQQGEIIRLSIRYSSGSQSKYLLSNRNYTGVAD